MSVIAQGHCQGKSAQMYKMGDGSLYADPKPLTESERSKYLQCIPGAGPSFFLFYVLPEELNEVADHLDDKRELMHLLRRSMRSSASLFEIWQDMAHWKWISIAPQKVNDTIEKICKSWLAAVTRRNPQSQENPRRVGAAREEWTQYQIGLDLAGSHVNESAFSCLVGAVRDKFGPRRVLKQYVRTTPFAHGGTKLVTQQSITHSQSFNFILHQGVDKNGFRNWNDTFHGFPPTTEIRSAQVHMQWGTGTNNLVTDPIALWAIWVQLSQAWLHVNPIPSGPFCHVRSHQQTAPSPHKRNHPHRVHSWLTTPAMTTTARTTPLQAACERNRNDEDDDDVAVAECPLRQHQPQLPHYRRRGGGGNASSHPCAEGTASGAPLMWAKTPVRNLDEDAAAGGRGYEPQILVHQRERPLCKPHIIRCVNDDVDCINDSKVKLYGTTRRVDECVGCSLTFIDEQGWPQRRTGSQLN
ncbi:hypothetical protein BJY52DRAFT_1416090 [Lactarius psammicola]|nr:hypothetical protein BJY52DRAFT_1416090 [Lactarius psammicola]